MSNEATKTDEEQMKLHLEGLTKTWNETRRESAGKVNGSNYVIVPDGKGYIGIVTELTMKATKEKKLPMLVWLIEITEGNFAGKKVSHTKVITEKTIQMVMTDLLKCGIDVVNITDIAAYLPQGRGMKLDFDIKTVGENRNIYINKRLDEVVTTSGDELEHIERLTDDFPVN